jgi:glycosyltransferase involved in cell wall biosynthesis
MNGGAALVAIQSAIALARRGVTVDYFCAVGPPDPALAEAGVRVTCLNQDAFTDAPNVPRALFEGLWNPAAARAFRRLLSTVDAEGAIIHVHGWTKALSASVLDAALRAPMPTVVTLHEYFTACPNGGLYNYQTQSPCTLRPMGAACIATHCDSRGYGHKLWRVARQAIAQHGAGVPGRLRHLVYISEFSRGVLQAHLPGDAQWRMVHNPINVVRAPRVRVEENRDFLFLGRLSPEKGALLLAEAGARAGAPVRFVGDGGERAAIEQRWPQSKLMGWMAPDKAMAQLAEARALVFPSLWYETQGLSVYEALARGVPVIVADDIAARDAVIDGVNGLLFRRGDAADLADKIVAFADDARVKAMSEAAHANYWAHPATPELHLDELLAAYSGVLSEHGIPNQP